MAKDRDNGIVLVVIRDDEGRERPMPYRVSESVKADLAALQEDLDLGDTVVRHYVLPKDNYFVNHILALAELGQGEAGSDALGALGELLDAAALAYRELNK